MSIQPCAMSCVLCELEALGRVCEGCSIGAHYAVLGDVLWIRLDYLELSPMTSDSTSYIVAPCLLSMTLMQRGTASHVASFSEKGC